MTDIDQPRPPAGLKARGKAFWAFINGELELEGHELELLAEACRVMDRLDALDRVVRKEGPMTPDHRAHPALVEARQQQITLTRVIAAMRLPDDFTDPQRRPQRRQARGAYQPTPITAIRREA